jgi:hypothetical protein
LATKAERRKLMQSAFDEFLGKYDSPDDRLILAQVIMEAVDRFAPLDEDEVPVGDANTTNVAGDFKIEGSGEVRLV